jgi:hypothetical protein
VAYSREQAASRVTYLLLKQELGYKLTRGDKAVLAYLYTARACEQKIQPKVYGYG